MTVEKIDPVSYVFNKLAAYYGAAWDKSLGLAPLADIKTVWQHELENFTHTPEAKMAIIWALDNLPERPLNAIAFRNLCRQAPAAEKPQLPAPRPDPARIAAEIAKLTEVRKRVDGVKSDSLDWAHRLKAKDEHNPKSVSITVRKMYQEALKGAPA